MVGIDKAFSELVRGIGYLNKKLHKISYFNY